MLFVNLLLKLTRRFRLLLTASELKSDNRSTNLSLKCLTMKEKKWLLLTASITYDLFSLVFILFRHWFWDSWSSDLLRIICTHAWTDTGTFHFSFCVWTGKRLPLCMEPFVMFRERKRERFMWSLCFCNILEVLRSSFALGGGGMSIFRRHVRNSKPK